MDTSSLHSLAATKDKHRHILFKNPHVSSVGLSFGCRGSAETCEHGIQLSLLQHSTLISEKKHPGIVDPLKGICDTVDTPPASPYADEINSCYFYAAR